MRGRPGFGLTLVLMLLAAFPAAADAASVVVDLGAGKATALNNNGVVVGQDLTAPYAGFVWQSGTRTALAGTGTGPGTYSTEGYETASDINDLGRISGTVSVSGRPRGVFWDSPTAYTEIGLLQQHGTSSAVSTGIGVDQSGDIA